MADNVITEPNFQPGLGPAQDPAADQIQDADGGFLPPSIYGMDLNYAAANSWYLYLPIENILGKSYDGLNLHVTRFSLPQMEITSATVSYKGYSKEIPTKVINADSKMLTIEYIVDENWVNYACLYAWLSHVYGALNPMIQDDDTAPIQPSDYLLLRLYLLDNYKRKIMEFQFMDCWIKNFGDLALDVTNAGETHHSFTICYDTYKIEKSRNFGILKPE